MNNLSIEWKLYIGSGAMENPAPLLSDERLQATVGIASAFALLAATILLISKID